MALTQAQADAIAAQSAAPSISGLGWADIPSSQFTAGLLGGASSWSGGMGALAGALGFDTEGFVRRKQAESAFYQRNAPGTTQFFGEDGVTGSGSLTDYMAYLTGMAIPYVGEFAVGAATGGLGLAGSAAKMASAKAIAAQAARNLGGKEAASAAAERTALELAAKQVGQRYGASAGGVAASYPSAVGDILGNQLEAGVAFDDMQLAPALAGGVPYAALNLLGGEGAVLRAVTGATRGTGAKGLVKSTLAGENLPGAMVRGGVRAGLAEGAGETGQEMINQLAGQMAVNPNKEFLSPDALHRYAESFASGMFGPGGPMGAVSQVFAKPIDATPEAIATRTSQLDEALQNIQAGHQTWMDQKDQAKNDAEQTKKDIEEQLKQEEADFYAGVDQDEKAKKAHTDKLGATAKLLKSIADLKKVDDNKEMTDFALGQIPDDLLTGIRATDGTLIPPLVGPMQTPVAKRDTPHRLSPEQIVMDAQNTLRTLKPGDPFASLLEALALSDIAAAKRDAATPFPDGSLFNPGRRPDFALTPFANPAPAPLSPADRLTQFNKNLGIGVKLDPMAEVNAFFNERDYEGRVAQHNDNQAAARAGQTRLDFSAPATQNRAARRAGLQAAYDRSKAIEAEAKRRGDVVAASNAALDAAEAEKALQEEQAWQQANADPRYGMVPDMFGRSPDFPSTPASPTAPNLANANEFVTEGLRISEEYKQAAATGNLAAMARLDQEGQALYERMAQGFPRDLADTSTPTLFQNREGDAGPTVTATGKAASGNAFKPKKEKTRGTQAPQAKQAEPAASAVEEPTATPATGAVDLNALLAKFMADIDAPLTPEQAQKVHDAQQGGAAPTPTPADTISVLAQQLGISADQVAASKAAADKEAADAAAQKERLDALAAKRKKPKANPYAEGVEAAKAGVVPDTNPYKGDTANAKAWGAGYLDTKYPKTTPTEEVAAEVDEEAAYAALAAKAEAEIDAGPIGVAARKLEDVDGLENNDGNPDKRKIKAYAKKLEKAGIIDDAELNDDGRDTDASELLDELSQKVDEARNAAIQERIDELEQEAQEEVAEPTPAAETEPETNLLPELDAPWNVRKENRTRIEQLAAKGDEAKIAREWNEQYGDKFQFPELARDLQLLAKHAIEAVEVNKTTRRTQNKMSLDLADRIEQEQAARNEAKSTTTTEETQNEPSTVEESPVPAQEEGQDAVPAQEEALPEVAPAAQDNEADAAEALANIAALPGRTLSSKKAKVQVELETDGAFTDSMSPVNAVEFTNEKIRAYDAMRKACLGG